MKSAVIIQARNSSTRYPQKMLHNFIGKPAIGWVLERCSKANIDYKILATSLDSDDDSLVEIAQKNNWNVVRGSVNDVLSRYAQAVKEYGLDVLVRITGDCILTDYRLINYALIKLKETESDYLILTNIVDGFDVEVLTGKAVIEADKKAKLPSEREHVTPFIKKSKQLKITCLPYGNEDLSNIHLSLDYKEDAYVLEQILKRFKNKDFTYDDIVNLIKSEPRIIEKTKHVIPNEGYQKAMLKDKDFVKGLKGKRLKLKRNLALFKKTKELIPNCSQTFSKSYLQFSVGSSPLFVKEGQGCYLTDVDRNKFIDYTMGLGACILGYAFEPVMRDIKKQMRKGSVYSLPHYFEYELAELLTHIIPSAEMVRFGKNGSDVTSAAVRLARAYTGRDYIACCGYHGWQDWYIATTTRCKGIPGDVKNLSLTFQFNNIESIEKLFTEYKDKISGVIMEPVSLEPPKDDFLHKVKEIANKYGALLIFDEVVTGFRFSIGGAQQFFSVIPDIACFGKAMGNGMPIACIVGRKDIMKLFDEIFFSFTFGGETLSIASALSTIKFLAKNNIIDFIWEQGSKLKDQIGRLIREKEMDTVISIDGYPIRTVMNFKGEEKDSLKMKTLFQQECVKRGILFTGAHNMSLPHNDGIIDQTLSVYDEVMDILKYSIEYDMLDEMIEGNLLEPVFRKV